MPTLVVFGHPYLTPGDPERQSFNQQMDSLTVQEPPTEVLEALGRGAFARLTLLHAQHKTPLGDVWVNPAVVRFVRETS